MMKLSVAYIYEQKQDDTSRKDVIVQFKNNEVLCPMCEVWHDNNSLCQINHGWEK